jgi:hypothetical protein
MKLVNIKILALLVISYSFALVAMTPLTWLLPMVEPRVQAVGISLSEVNGSLWNGQALVKEKNIGSLNVQWDVKLGSLLLLKAPIEITASNSNLNVEGVVTLSPFNLSVSELNGYIDEAAFQSIYKAYRADISGRLQINSVAATMSWGKQLGEASGDLSWSGGPISIPVGRSTQNYEVPTMLGVVTSDDNQWVANINGSASQQYIQASLTQEGMATLSVKRILATEMNIPVPGSGSSLLDVSQQVF